MTGRAKAAAAFTALGSAAVGAVAGVQLTDSTPAPVGLIGQPVKSFTIEPNCQVTPGKMWGGRWHYSLQIQFPTVLQKACWSQRKPPLGTLVRVSLVPVPAAPVPAGVAP